MAYDRIWSSAHPGCLIVLLDWSRSMIHRFGGSSSAGQHKSDMVATIVNNVLDELVRVNTVPPDNVRPRVDVGVIGYEGGRVRSALPPPLDIPPLVGLRELAANPLRIERRIVKRVDPSGELYDDVQGLSIWVEPVAAGDSPMCAALGRAHAVASDWVTRHRVSYPPVVVNITDGQATDGDPTDIARRLMQLSTENGRLLLFNCHITSGAGAPREFPRSTAELPADRYATLLFRISSEIPEQARTAFLNATQRDLAPGTRGYIFNGDAVSIRKMLSFGSTAAGLEADPSR